MPQNSTPLKFRKFLDNVIANKIPDLDLSEFGLSYIPEEVCNLTFLKTLRVGDTKIYNFIFPENMGNLSSLEQLHIHNTQLEELPDSIFEIKSLKLLCLGGNMLRTINPNIIQLYNLEALHIAHNRFTEFPKEILSLINLRSLDISENAISFLPQEIRHLKRLQRFDIERNKFKIPKEILERNPKELIQYILDYQESRNRRALLEAKLIFIGSGGVGKSSLIKRLIKNEYDPKLTKTDGIEISDWSVKRKRDSIKLHIWDFGGQEIMHATHKFFMTSRSAYVVVINPRVQDKYGDLELEYWLKLIRSYAGIVPIVVVINKCEVHQMPIAKEELQSKYPNIVAFVETSCEKNVGIKELKNNIQKGIAKLEHIDDKLPETYFIIKEELEKINKDYIEYKEYEKLCKRIDPSFRPESKVTLVGLLHDLGVMLNFKENRMLKDTQVLNPEWVTQGVYQLINYPDLIKNKGILKVTELSKILDNNQYPTEKEQFYITDIMGHFELSFQLEGKSDTYFIPGAFPKDKPLFNWPYLASNLLRFQYHYDVLPTSIFSRFMVKIHRLIRKTDFWLNGVVIQFENCEALIKADFEEKTITVEVAGSGNRRVLLSIIREKFDDVHSNFKDINIKREIPIDNENKVLVSYDDLLLYEEANEESIFVPQLKTRFKVKYLLDGIEDEEIRKNRTLDSRKKAGVSMFISYSHSDEVLKDKLKTHLSNLANNNKIKTWDDREIPAGDEWEEEINNFLDTSEYILLLISSDFLSSKYCYSVEMQKAIERHNNKEAVVIPICLRSCDWSGAPFGKLQGLPKDMKPVTSWSNEDEAFTNIAKGISKSIENYLAKPH